MVWQNPVSSWDSAFLSHKGVCTRKCVLLEALLTGIATAGDYSDHA